MKSKTVESIFAYPSLVILVGVVLFLQSFMYDRSSAREKTISDFHLKNVDGRILGLGDYPEAKGFIIVFTSNHCPFAKLYTERLNDLYVKYAPHHIPLLAINSMDSLVYQDENFATMRQKSIAENQKFPYLYDQEQSVGKNFGAQFTPHAYVVWKENDEWKIKYSGAIDDNGADPTQVQNAYVDAAVQELLSLKAVTISETRSIGCAIYYRRK